jgi:hypothetical protein
MVVLSKTTLDTHTHSHHHHTTTLAPGPLPITPPNPVYPSAKIVQPPGGTPPLKSARRELMVLGGWGVGRG